MVNKILFRIRTGVLWRDLPQRYGSRKTVYERHRRWSADGTWDRILHPVQADAGLAGRVDWSVIGVDSSFRTPWWSTKSPRSVAAESTGRLPVAGIRALEALTRHGQHLARLGGRRGSRRQLLFRILRFSCAGAGSGCFLVRARPRVRSGRLTSRAAHLPRIGTLDGQDAIVILCPICTLE